MEEKDGRGKVAQMLRQVTGLVDLEVRSLNQIVKLICF